MQMVRFVEALLMLLLICAATAHAQYPSRAVRIVIPYPPGAITDTLPRLVAEKLREEWGQPVVVENRPGAGGRIGAEQVAKAAPDGHTLVIGISDNFAIAPYLFRNMNYDPLRDFTPVTILGRQSFIVVSRQDLPASGIADIVRLARAEPGKLRFGSWGEGSAGHLAMEMLKTAAGIDMQHIPYKGSAAAMLGMLGGEVDVMFAGYSSTLPQIRAGKLRVLARSSASRLPLTPDIPTIAESGFPGFEVQAWYGLFAPAQTPRSVVDQVHRSVARALTQPDIKARVDGFYAETVGNTPDEFARLLREEHSRWSEVLRKLKLSLD
jgi:tripartite-type tricarboxylate transporter receptor subunit TctC